MKEEVFSKLPQLDLGQLGQCGVQLNVTIPPAKMGNKTAVRSMILRHLTSEAVEDAEDVEEVFQALLVLVDRLLGPVIAPVIAAEVAKTETTDTNTEAVEDENKSTEGKIKMESKVDEGKGETSYAAATGNQIDEKTITTHSTGTTRLELSRFKEFKVKPGTFGGDNKLNYKSLVYQIQEAKSLKHTDREIVSGIISGMKADSALQNYFQGKFNWTLDSCLTHLQNICDVRESTVLLDLLRDAAQGDTDPKETEMNFLLRVLGYRDDIVEVSKDEEEPISEAAVQKKMFRTLSVGFKKDTIRLMLGPLLKTGKVEDHVLMKEVKQAMALQKESEDKSSGGNSCNNLNASKMAQRSEMDEKVLKLLDKLDSRMGKMEVQVNTINEKQQQYNNNNHNNNNHNDNNNSTATTTTTTGEGARRGGGGGNGGGGGGNRYRFIKCTSCEERRVYCTHCSLCGKGGHKRRDCTAAAADGNGNLNE